MVNLSKKALMPPELEILKNNDRENNARLLETLKVYLESERNSTLTAQILKIHRSTLPYRLNHIFRLTGLNLDDYHTRLYLMMGLYAMEHIKRALFDISYQKDIPVKIRKL